MLGKSNAAAERSGLAPPGLAPRCFAERLLAWWDVHGRKNLPWQRQRSPYRAWVAEVMLQQTQVSVVIPYFQRFVARFPTVAALADAELDDVLHLWSGLGYYARARNLHRAAEVVVREHGGALPCSAEGIAALPGVGRSTAAAIAAQAYGERAAILDGNAKRVLARCWRVAGAASSAATNKALWELAEACTPAERVADYTQAIMDLGATVCTRRNPRCGECPLEDSCAGRAEGDAERFPMPAVRRSRRLERRRFFVLIDARGDCFLERRPPHGIWGGLWSPPERSASTSAAEFLTSLGGDARLVRRSRVAPPFKHGFTHYDLDVRPVYVWLKARPALLGEREDAWVDPADHRLGLSAVAARLLAAVATFRLEPNDGT